jgi:hypothetical protein
MSEIDDKLERGADLLADAGGDPDLLGAALLAFQGALVARLRALLGTHPGLDDRERALLADPSATPSALVELGQQCGDLTREQAWRIQDAERLRVGFANGGPFRGAPSEVRAYGRFVAEFCGRADLADELAQILAARAGAPDQEEELDYEQEPAPTFSEAAMRWLPGLALVLLISVAAWLLIGRGAGLPGRTSAPTAVAGGAEAIAPNATFGPMTIVQATPTALPTPTLAARQGRVVRLGGGPGWLHETPSFDSPTLPIRLSEGQAVAIVGPQQSDAQGTPWIAVAVGGYQGWSPLNNIEETR